MSENRFPIALVVVPVSLVTIWAVTPRLRAANHIALPYTDMGDASGLMLVLGVGGMALLFAAILAVITVFARAARPPRRERRTHEPTYVVYG